MRIVPLGVLIACFALLNGCVERTMKIRTNPPGALVIVNDEEVGVSPVKFSFLWYGDYEIILRKPGYQTLKTHFKVNAPWWQYPPFDLVAETLIAGTIRDEHELPPFDLQPTPPTTPQELVGRATDMRGQAVFQP
jgi:hypothetical protein